MGEALWRHHDGVQPLPKVSLNTQASHSLRSNEALHLTSGCGLLAALALFDRLQVNFCVMQQQTNKSREGSFHPCEHRA